MELLLEVVIVVANCNDTEGEMKFSYCSKIISVLDGDNDGDESGWCD